MLAQLGLDLIEADLVSTSVSVSVGERSDESQGPRGRHSVVSHKKP